MLDTVVRKLIEYGYERAFRQMLLAQLGAASGDDQLPEVWAAHRAALARLDIDEIPDLYMAQMPIINASGDRRRASRWWCSTRARSSCSTSWSCAPCSATRPATSCPTT